MVVISELPLPLFFGLCRLAPVVLELSLCTLVSLLMLPASGRAECT